MATSHDLGPQKVAEEGKSRLVKYYDLASFMIFHFVPKEWRGYRPTVHLVWRGAERSEKRGETKTKRKKIGFGESTNKDEIIYKLYKDKIHSHRMS